MLSLLEILGNKRSILFYVLPFIKLGQLTMDWKDFWNILQHHILCDFKFLHKRNIQKSSVARGVEESVQ